MWFMTMREKQILARAVGLLESKKKIGGNHAFFGDNYKTIILKNSKIQSNVWRYISKLKLYYL